MHVIDLIVNNSFMHVFNFTTFFYPIHLLVNPWLLYLAQKTNSKIIAEM